MDMLCWTKKSYTITPIQENTIAHDDNPKDIQQ